MSDSIVEKRMAEYYAQVKRSWESSLDATLRRISDLVPRLPDVDRLTDEACKFAKGKVQGGVNWGDLHCIEASLVISLEGEAYFQVSIEEASPDAHEFREFIHKYLEERGYIVHVLTEW